MQSKKGIYLLIVFISAILIFFCILFFVHENTLENGILFTVSFQYEGAKDIKYNFYNQNGKIEKIEEQNTFLLEKTDYNSVKLLRKITKNRKESKTPYEEEGILIYNGQNKRYYLIPYDSDSAKELSSLIIDGYIHSELERTTGNDLYKELYLYQTDTSKNWTKNGNQDKIIHTYTCQNEDCKYIYVEKENETILWDEKYYLYNYQTGLKEEIITETDIVNAKFITYQDEIKGIEITNKEKKTALYDLERKEIVSDFTEEVYSYITNDLFLKQKTTKKEENITYNLFVMDKNTKNEIWEINLEEKNEMVLNIIKITIKETDYFVLIKNEKENYTYQLLSANGELINKQLPKVEENFIINEKDLSLNETDFYKVYNNQGNLIKETDNKKELEEIE